MSSVAVGEAKGARKAVAKAEEKEGAEPKGASRARAARMPDLEKHDLTDFHKVFEGAPMGAYRILPTGEIVGCNDSLVELLGFHTQDEIRGRSLKEFRSIPQYTWDEFRRRLGPSGQIQGLESFWIRKDGSRMIAKENVWTIQGPNHSLLYYEGVISDVTTKKIDEALRVFRTVFEAIPVGFLQMDAQGRFLQNNPAFQKMLGQDDEGLRAALYSDLTHPDDRERDVHHLAELVRGERDHYRVEKRYRRKDRSYVWVQETVSAIYDSHRQAQVINAVVEDITQRREVEQRVHQRTAELEAANKELESFAYSVSHDLRTPLRAIEGFSSLILIEHGTKLDEEARTLFERIRAATKRMAQLIEDLLHLSRISRSEIVRESVDLTAMGHAIIDELKQRDTARNAQVTIKPEMRAEGDPRLVRSVLENLLANAWKFSARRVPAVIELGAKRTRGEQVFYVKDNGAGFDMAFAGKLFQPFQRLHSAADFEGTGVGLASVQRIVQRHGGRIWAEGRPDEGATFYFTLG